MANEEYTFEEIVANGLGLLNMDRMNAATTQEELDAASIASMGSPTIFWLVEHYWKKGGAIRDVSKSIMAKLDGNEWADLLRPNGLNLED